MPALSDYADALRSALGDDAAMASGAAFADQICGDLAEDERGLLSPDDLAKAAADLWAFAARRIDDGPQVRLVELSALVLREIAADLIREGRARGHGGVVS